MYNVDTSPTKNPTVAEENPFEMYETQSTPASTFQAPVQSPSSSNPQPAPFKLQPNRRPPEIDAELGDTAYVPMRLTEDNLVRHNHPIRRMNHFVHSFHSPIGAPLLF